MKARHEQGGSAVGLDPAVVGTDGLTSDEAAKRLAIDGPNAIPEPHRNKALVLAAKLWGPVPWLLEAAIVLELLLGNFAQAVIIAILVGLDAVLSFREEGDAQAALDLLRKRLTIEARVYRDGNWTRLAAAELVRDDLVHIRQGDLVPADLVLTTGEVALDQSVLTGESNAVGVGSGEHAYSGATVVRGEASGHVEATGASTFFGRTAELVGSSHAPGRLEQLIMGFVKALLALDVALVAVVLADGALRHLSWASLLPFAVILVVAAVPVALPTTFTLASALGSRELADRGALVTRLATIEEAASMEVLCSDKTGTITENHLTLTSLKPYGSCDEAHLLQAAAAASDEATQDPLDLAILAGFQTRDIGSLGARQSFQPFDPATKRSEATVNTATGLVTVVKGAPQVVAQASAAGTKSETIAGDVAALSATGARVLGVAEGVSNGPLTFVGLVALADPPRPDSTRLIVHLKSLGVRVVMVTGDGLATASAIARRVGVGVRAARAAELREHAESGLGLDQLSDVYAEVLPEDKLQLVSRLQQSGLVVGMTGDGVNDAPALRRADVGIAVSNATDVAKAAAGMVLTDPGLDNIVSGIQVSRRIHERMLTYTLNKIVKTLQVSIFLSLGFLIFGKFVTTPLLVVLLLLANNFATMSLATDRVGTPQKPEQWTVRSLVMASAGLAVPLILLSFGVWFTGSLGLHLHTDQLQTLIFVWLVTSAQATIYSVRERHHFWHSAPSAWLAASSIADMVAVTVLAWRGWLMTPIGPAALAVGFGAGLVFLALGDSIKGWIFRSAGLAH
jgi:H+-transporting ATPase